MLPELQLLTLTIYSPMLPSQLLERVRQHIQRGEETETIVLLASYMEENPFHGDLWHVLGRYYEEAREYEQAIDAYQKAIECGNRWSGDTEYHLASTLMHQGKDKEAVSWLEKALRISFRLLPELESDNLWEPLRSNERNGSLFAPRLSPTLDRITGWRADLAYMARRMEQGHYDLFGRETPLSREVWQAVIADLDQHIPTLEDHEIVVELMRIVALAGDGHTNLFPFGVEQGYLAEQKGLFDYAPVMFYLFEDGLFVRGAKQEYKETVGARVLRIGSVTAEEALERIKPLVFNDNIMQIKRQGPLLLSCPAIAHALGISESREYLDVQLQQEMKEPFNVRLHKNADIPPWFVWLSVEPENWVSMCDGALPRPLWLKQSELYWFEYLEDQQIVYCQYNGVQNMKEESLATFSERLFAFIEDHEVRALVLDLRRNGGGDLTTYRPLLHGIIQNRKVNRWGSLFALIGRHTFSAAQHFINQLDTHTEVTFVGECSGSRPQFVGEGNPFRLPYSGLDVNISNRFWQGTFALDGRLWIAPHIRAEFTSHDYRANRDPALEAILAEL